MEDKSSLHVELPLTLGLCGAFSHFSSFIAILNSYEECKPWLFSNFIQICTKDKYYKIGRGGIEFYFNPWGDFQFYHQCTCPWIQYNCVAREDVSEHWTSFIKFLIEKIDSKEYIYVTLDRSELQCCQNEGCHPLLVFGYDKDKGIFNIADNFDNGKYSVKEASFDDMERSYNIPVEQDAIIARTRGVRTLRKLDIVNDFEIYKSVCPEHYQRQLENTRFRINYVKQELRRYLRIEKPLEYLDDSIYIYGIECLELFIESLIHIRDTDYFDIRPISCLVDHKKLMYERLRFMMERYDDKLMRTVESYAEVYNLTAACRGLLIKYNITQDDKILLRCEKIMKDVIMKENEILLPLALAD